MREFSHDSFAFICSIYIHLHFVGEVSHESFVFASSTSTLWGKSRTKASFSYLPLSLCEGSLAGTHCLHIFNYHVLREVSHESFVFTSSTITLWGKFHRKYLFSHVQLSLFLGNPRANASFLYIPLSLCEGSLALKLRFHACNYHYLRAVSHERFVSMTLHCSFWRMFRTETWSFTPSVCMFLKEVLYESFSCDLCISNLKALTLFQKWPYYVHIIYYRVFSRGQDLVRFGNACAFRCRHVVHDISTVIFPKKGFQLNGLNSFSCHVLCYSV